MTNSAIETSLQTLLALDERVALVTGGAGHLGTAISATLAELGADVVIAGRTRTACVQRADEITRALEPRGRVVGERIDVMDAASIESAIGRIHDRFGAVGILVNNAWHGRKNTWESITYEDWKHDVDMSLNSVYRVTQALFDDLKSRKGTVLNVGSMYGHVAPDHRLYDDESTANPPSYGAAKAGVLQFTRYLASFLAPHGIRVNAISPGPFPFPEVAEENPGFARRLAARNPLDRIGTPHEIKGAVALLCSDASSYMTGQNVCVDGGWTIW